MEGSILGHFDFKGLPYQMEGFYSERDLLQMGVSGELTFFVRLTFYNQHRHVRLSIRLIKMFLNSRKPKIAGITKNDLCVKFLDASRLKNEHP